MPNPVVFLLDSGAGPCLIKRKFVLAPAEIDETNILHLIGISPQLVPTLGKVVLSLLGCFTEFHMVPDDFPILQDGIIGTSFLSKHKAKINWEGNQLELNDLSIPFSNQAGSYTIPARTRKIVHVRLKNTELSEGYVPRFDLPYGIYMGNALVKNRQGKAYLALINTTAEEVHFAVPEVELRETETAERELSKIPSPTQA